MAFYATSVNLAVLACFTRRLSNIRNIWIRCDGLSYPYQSSHSFLLQMWTYVVYIHG